MYPNPQDVVPLPPKPDLDQYRKRAKELLHASRTDATSLHVWARGWIDALDRLQPSPSKTLEADRARRALQLTHFARERLEGSGGTLTQAQFVLARAHGFESWPRLADHLERLHQSGSVVSAFERAAEAIVSGDLDAVTALIAADPALVRARSTREHRATLLHYVSANGVETYRQRTPANIVAITRALLDRGAEVDAVADVYGGLTTFALVVTSEGPRRAGVQNELADLLLARGARMDDRIVHYCLVNGCPEAAAHLADLGAPVGPIEAAGIGRTDLIRRAFAKPHEISPAVQGGAMVMAAWSYQRAAIALMLELGVPAGATRDHDRQTALHVASFQGDFALVEVLLQHGAPLDVVDAEYGTTPLQWALHTWLVMNRPEVDGYLRIVEALVRAGAAVKRDWLEDRRLHEHPALLALMTTAAEEAR